MSNQLCTGLVVIWPSDQLVVLGSKPGDLSLKVESLWLCPHTATGAQLGVQATLLADLELPADWVVIAKNDRLEHPNYSIISTQYINSSKNSFYV